MLISDQPCYSTAKLLVAHVDSSCEVLCTRLTGPETGHLARVGTFKHLGSR